VTKEIINSAQNVDFSILTVREIRDVLKSKAHCLRAGFPSDHMIIKTLNEFRDHYANRVGMPTYLSQMLGNLGQVQIQHCNMYAENGYLIRLQLNGNHNQPIQRFISQHFLVEDLPFKVEIRPNPDLEQFEVRYL
jgi:hypothetical protein